MQSLKTKFKNKLAPTIQNFKSWKTNRKIIVFESDDWGSIRMPNKKVFEETIKYGVDVSKCPFNTYDTLANSDDFEALFDILIKFKDSVGNHPIITANTIVANPDFEKIANDNFHNYHYEPFTKTIEKYYPNKNVFNYWKEGIHNKIFRPQLHGREHLYVRLWMDFLKNKSDETLFAFQNNFFGISTTISKEKRSSFLPALDLYSFTEIQDQKIIIEEAQSIFFSKFGFNSKSFIAPNYTWSQQLEPILKNIGIETLQGSKYQQQPIIGVGTRRIKHYTGEVNSSGQVYLSRNVQFEPSINKELDWFNLVLNEIENAFFWKTPAIVSVHRLNFIGGLKTENRNENLKMFTSILSTILKRWPDVEFLSSDELGFLIANKK